MRRLLMVLLLLSLPARAEFPDRPLRMVVGFAAGGIPASVAVLQAPTDGHRGLRGLI